MSQGNPLTTVTKAVEDDAPQIFSWPTAIVLLAGIGISSYCALKGYNTPAVVTAIVTFILNSHLPFLFPNSKAKEISTIQELAMNRIDAKQRANAARYIEAVKSLPVKPS